MRHRKSGRKLKRTASHRKALLISLSTALLRHKKVQTTTAKAKEARAFVERLITKAKNVLAIDDQKKKIHARRMVARFIKDRKVVKELFEVIAPKIANRPGGYTRVIKLGQRHGDNAEVAVLELVDFNIGQAPDKASAKPKSKKEKAVKKVEAAL